MEEEEKFKESASGALSTLALSRQEERKIRNFWKLKFFTPLILMLSFLRERKSEVRDCQWLVLKDYDMMSLRQQFCTSQRFLVTREKIEFWSMKFKWFIKVKKYEIYFNV